MEIKKEIELNGKMYWIDKKELDALNKFNKDRLKQMDKEVYSGALSTLGLI